MPMSATNVDSATGTANGSGSEGNDTCVSVEAGICGFTCFIRTRRIAKHTVSIRLSRSECGQIQRLAERLTQMTLTELFTPVTRNPAYVNAQKSGCHSSCVVPAAVLKAVEVAMGMALPKDVVLRFEPCARSGSNAEQQSRQL